MILQCVAIPLVLLWRTLDLGWPGAGLLVTATDIATLGVVWLMFAVTMFSGLRYVSAAARVLRSQGDVRGSS
jgi:hypothetical protein